MPVDPPLPAPGHHRGGRPHRQLPDLEQAIDADHIVRGDGIAWFRQFLGQSLDAPVKHPEATSAFGTRIMGINLPDKPGDTAAILIPSVGCPVGCNFLRHFGPFRRQGEVYQFLRNRRRTV